MNKKINLSGVDASTWIRTIFMIMSFINLGLRFLGKEDVSLSNEQLSEITSIIFAAVTSFVAWWKNNSFTDLAQKADMVLKEKNV